MKKQQETSKRERTAAVGLVVCFVAMIATVGMITFSRYEKGTKQKEQDMIDVKKTEDDELELSQTTNTDEIQAEIEKIVVEKDVVLPEVSQEPGLTFGAGTVIGWPIEGNVILSYSMDKTIYFSTLDQYKYNPALIIGGDIGDEVHASTIGEVISIETTAQTGVTVTMSLGSGYQVVYGQLKDVCVEKGQRVEKGDLIGCINEPTKYYSVEGPNLYFQLLKDGNPVNPLEYLEA